MNTIKKYWISLISGLMLAFGVIACDRSDGPIEAYMETNEAGVSVAFSAAAVGVTECTLTFTQPAPSTFTKTQVVPVGVATFIALDPADYQCAVACGDYEGNASLHIGEGATVDLTVRLTKKTPPPPPPTPGVNITIVLPPEDGTVEFTGPTAGSIAPGAQDAVLFSLVINSGQGLTVTSTGITLEGIAGGYLKSSTGTPYFTDIKIRNKANGATVAGPLSLPGSVASKATTANLTMPDDFEVSGIVEYEITVDVAATEVAATDEFLGEGYRVKLNSFSSVGTLNFTEPIVGSTQTVGAAAPGTNCTGTTRTVADGWETGWKALSVGATGGTSSVVTDGTCQSIELSGPSSATPDYHKLQLTKKVGMGAGENRIFCGSYKAKGSEGGEISLEIEGGYADFYEFENVTPGGYTERCVTYTALKTGTATVTIKAGMLPAGVNLLVWGAEDKLR